MPKKSIAILGLWHLGEVYSACLAEIGHSVIGYSEDKDLIEKFKKNIPPLAEPGLPELLEKNQKSGNLSFTTDFSSIRNCDVVWLTFDVPVDQDDKADISGVLQAVRKISPLLKQNVTITVSSQIPVGTSQLIIKKIKTLRPDLSFNYFYTPENLRLGDAVKCFMEPQRIVIGAQQPEALTTARDIFMPLEAEIIAMSTASAEMAKHAMNAWLATSISFTNDLADICEKMGADIEEVVQALKSEPRVGHKAYLFAGLGFSGGTLARDVQSLLSAAKKLKTDLPVIRGTLEKNKRRHSVVVPHLKQSMGSLRGKTITLLGVTYKSGTSTLRRSQPLLIEQELRKVGAKVRLYDPLANPKDIAAYTKSFFTDDLYKAAEGSNAIVVTVPDFSLKDTDFKRLAAVMHKPRIFDAQNVLVSKEKEIREAGFSYSSIGRS